MGMMSPASGIAPHSQLSSSISARPMRSVWIRMNPPPLIPIYGCVPPAAPKYRCRPSMIGNELMYRSCEPVMVASPITRLSLVRSWKTSHDAPRPMVVLGRNSLRKSRPNPRKLVSSTQFFVSSTGMEMFQVAMPNQSCARDAAGTQRMTRPARAMERMSFMGLLLSLAQVQRLGESLVKGVVDALRIGGAIGKSVQRRGPDRRHTFPARVDAIGIRHGNENRADTVGVRDATAARIPRIPSPVGRIAAVPVVPVPAVVRIALVIDHRRGGEHVHVGRRRIQHAREAERVHVLHDSIQ